MKKLPALRWLNQGCMIVAAFWALMLAVNITADVIGRGAFNRPLTGTVEIITHSIVMIVFLQLPYAVSSSSMLKADFILEALPPFLRRIVGVFNPILGACLFGLVVLGAIEPMTQAYVRHEYEGEGALRVSIWPVYAVIVFGSALTTINYLVHATNAVFSRKEDQ